MVAQMADRADDGIGESFPSLPCMRTSLMFADGECGVEHQHALLCPASQVAVLGHGLAGVGLQFLEDVAERRGNPNSVGHREAQSLSLSGLMIGVLSQHDHFYLLKGTYAKCREYVIGIGIAHVAGIFGLDK